MEPQGLLSHLQQPAFEVFRNIVIFLWWGVVSTSPNP
jgi:hypothetical protein